jgi:tetratricopeptide (TPR) repeat protein
MKAIGSTPLVISSSEVQAKIGSSGPVIIELRKDGYRDLRFLVTDLAPVDLSISSELQRATGLEDVEKLNAVVDALFEAQRLTRAGRLEDALKEVRFVQKEAPQISASYEIEGGVYYLQKKLPQAFDAYSTAVKQNPRNAEAARMRNYLQTALGLGGKMEPGSGEGRNKAEKPRKSGSSGGRKTR